MRFYLEQFSHRCGYPTGTFPPGGQNVFRPVENTLPRQSFLPSLTRVRFGDLFDYLEEDFSLSSEGSIQNQSGERDRLDPTLTGLFLRAKRSRTAITVGCAGGQVLSLRPRGVGHDWVSGTLGEAQMRGVILPLATIEWADVSPGQAGEGVAQITQARFRDVLNDLAHREQSVSVQLTTGALVGVVTTVGTDYLDLRRDTEGGAVLRRINLTAVAMVTLVDSLHWG